MRLQNMKVKRFPLPRQRQGMVLLYSEKTSKYKITLTDLTEDADLFLLDENERTIAVSGKKKALKMKNYLEAGSREKYYIGVWSVKRSETDFTLDIDRL